VNQLNCYGLVPHHCSGAFSPNSKAITVGRIVIKPTSCVQNLGVLFDSELSMLEHISRVVQTICVVYNMYVDNSAVKSQPGYFLLSCFHGLITVTPSLVAYP